MRSIDLDAIEAAWAARDASALDAAAARSGVLVTLEQLTQLGSMIRGSLTHREILLTISDALREPSGVAARETIKTIHSADLFAKEVCLAVRGERAITVGIRRLRYGTDDLTAAWRELAPLVRPYNRALFAGWAAQTLDDRVRIALGDIPWPTAADDSLLIAEIVESPEDPAPRMVLADHLLAREDVRGELIQLDLALRNQEVARRGELTARARRITAEQHRYLAGPIADVVDDYEIRGGFVDTVTMTGQRFERDGAGVFAQQPVRQLTVKLDDPGLAALVRSPHLATVRALKLIGQPREPVAALAPLVTARLDRLEALDLTSFHLAGRDGARLLGQLPAVRELQLRACTVDSESLRALVANRPLTAALGELRAQFVNPSGAGSNPAVNPAPAIDDVLANTSALHFPALRVLSLNFCAFASDRGAAGIVRGAPALEELACQEASDLTFAAALSRCAHLRSVVVARALSSAVIGQLVRHPSLVTIHLAFDAIDPVSCEELATALIAVPATRPLRVELSKPPPALEPIAARLRARFGGQ